MREWSARTAMLVGEDGVQQLAKKHVAVFGVGGVGGFVCEALARAGVGKISVFDDDIVSESNLNRQIVALRSTIGLAKVEVIEKRIADINPACEVYAHRVFYLSENAAKYPLKSYDYIVDAVDTVSAKLMLVKQAKKENVPIICSMGAGNKIYPEQFTLADISKTSVCPLARVMRRELIKLGIKNVPVVYSMETPRIPTRTEAKPAVQAGQSLRSGAPKENTPGSISFVPAAAGLILAGAVVRNLLCLE